MLHVHVMAPLRCLPTCCCPYQTPWRTPRHSREVSPCPTAASRPLHWSKGMRSCQAEHEQVCDLLHCTDP